MVESRFGTPCAHITDLYVFIFLVPRTSSRTFVHFLKQYKPYHQQIVLPNV